MNFLNFDLKKGLIFFFFVALPLISINSQRQIGDVGWYDRPFSFLAGQMQNGFFTFSDGVRGTTALYLNLIDLKQEAAKVHAENQELKTRLSLLEELRRENDRLNHLLEFRNQNKMTLVAAKVIAKDLLSDHNTVQINKGSRHGLKTGMAVITTEGVVGSILNTEMNTAKVLLITDRYAVVDGVDARSRARGIVEGFNQGSCILRYVEKSDDIQVGDLIVTSGIDNIFPKGFPVAKVESIENLSFAVSMKVQLHPVIDSNRVEEVFIITDAAHEEWKTTQTAAVEEKK